MAAVTAMFLIAGVTALLVPQPWNAAASVTAVVFLSLTLLSFLLVLKTNAAGLKSISRDLAKQKLLYAKFNADQVQLSSQHSDEFKALERESADLLASLRSLQNQSTAMVTGIRNLSEEMSDLTSSNVEWNRSISDNVTSLSESLAQHLDRPASGSEELLRIAMLSADGIYAKAGAFFAPSRVSSHEILSRPSSQQAGRNAANQVGSGDPSEILGEMLSAESEAWTRTIAGVFDARLGNKLSAVASLERLRPGLLLRGASSDVSYIVLDENALGAGTWAGTLTTAGTGDFLSLSEFLKDAKRNGSTVIVLASRRKSHFTHDLRTMADILVENGESNLRWDSDVHLPVLEVILSESA